MSTAGLETLLIFPARQYDDIGSDKVCFSRKPGRLCDLEETSW